MVTHYALKWSKAVMKSPTGQTVSCVGRLCREATLSWSVVVTNSQELCNPAVAIKLVFLTRSSVGFTAVMVRFFPTC